MPAEISILSTGAADSNAPAAIDPALAPDSTGRPLGDLSKEELEHWAAEFGLDATLFATRFDLAAAIQRRRAEIAGWNRPAMLELLRWGRRAAPANAANEQLAREIAAIRAMRFNGLSRDALVVLALMRQAHVSDADDLAALVHKLKRQEGLLEKLKRKKRAFLGRMVSNLVGDNPAPRASAASAASAASLPSPSAPADSIKEEIEESGLLSGITNRIKRTADQYLNQKLDEIESRIDRKLEEIDRRLGEWRDKEIANRLKILKITLWASVIVGIVSLIYSWLKLYLMAR